MNETPSVLIVDDEPDSLRAAVAIELEDRAKGRVVHPHDVELSHLEHADLVLVDFRLDNWPERDAQAALSLRPATGMALAALLREHVDRLGRNSPTAFALHSGHLGELQGRLPTVAAQHVIARLNNLEWAFQKTEPRRYEQMVRLANAVRRLPRSWPSVPGDSEAEARRLLGLDEKAPSFERCLRDVLECRVPVTELAEGAHGIVFVRWLLQQVMPHPCFLCGEHWVAARLRISLDSLRSVASGDTRLGKTCGPCGTPEILAEFMGHRWWRGALEDFVWDLVGSHASRGERFLRALTERAGMDLEFVEPNPAVVCLDRELQPMERFSSPETSVPVRPDHWPAFADSAWMDVEDVRADPALLAMVEPVDRYRVTAADD